MIKQILNIVPHGMIEDGMLTLLIDEKSGLLEAIIDFEVGISIFSKHIAKDQKVKIDPTALYSANIVRGLKINIGLLNIEVESIADKSAIAIVSASSADLNMKGKATLDLSGQYFSIASLRAHGTAEGYTVDLELQR